MITYHHAKGSRAKREVQNAIPTGIWLSVDEIPTTVKNVPSKANIVVTTANLSASIERFAANLGAVAAVLPECSEWLQDHVLYSVATQTDLVIVDAGCETAVA